MRSVYNFTKHKRVERKVLPVVDIIADIFAFLQLKVQETEATLVLDVKKGLTAWCDKTLIGQAILNLALNGLEAMKDQPCVRRELRIRSEEHTSELQSLMRISYAVFCLKKKNTKK